MVVMKFGEIKENDEIIKFNLELKCNNCNKKVSGGMKLSQNYFKTIEFNKKLQKFKKNIFVEFVEIKKELKFKLKFHH